MRYRKNITFRAGCGQRSPALRFVSRPDTAWIGQGTAFGPPTAQHRCTLLVVWYAKQEEPWIILTDLPPEEIGVSWCALRFWIELGFKALKSLGWKWDKTRRARAFAFDNFSHFIGASAYDEGGITYEMPTHACAERSERW